MKSSKHIKLSGGIEITISISLIYLVFEVTSISAHAENLRGKNNKYTNALSYFWGGD